MSSVGPGRAAAASASADGLPEGAGAPGVDAAPEVVEFIRYCYRRRGIGWPELYDEMCIVAARGSYRGMDYEQLARLGIGFSIPELPRLAALSQRVVAQERRDRGIAGRVARPERGEPGAPGASALVPAPAG